MDVEVCDGEYGVVVKYTRKGTMKYTDLVIGSGIGCYTVGLELSRSIASEELIQEKLEMLIQENAQKLYLALDEIQGLIKDERFLAL
ncbi:hypothetical protein Gotri_018889, partial [Gossypium trilobum]|nr:hypothetical protein [Gossypium trilobum]